MTYNVFGGTLNPTLLYYSEHRLHLQLNVFPNYPRVGEFCDI